MILPAITEKMATADALSKEGMTYRQIGERLGVSRGRAAQIVHKVKRIQAYASLEYNGKIESLPISVRTYNALLNAGITEIDQIPNLSSRELLKLKNFGRKSLRELETVLMERGLKLRSLKNCPHCGGAL